ncbi:MAG: 3'-5' exonuclease, partial [Planctomycetota bacterium]|nr:3'-5' exonuclease [Planctomycetota bacterium]
DLLDLDPRFTIYDADDQKRAVKRALAHLNLDPTHFDPRRCAEAISRAKTKLQRARDSQPPAGSDFRARHLGRIYEAYEAILAASSALDFDDLLLEVALGLRASADFRDHLHDRFRYVLIDEYQDTNHAQYVIARDLAGPRRNLCATGDPDQSIYGWRGARLENILDFEKDFPDARVVRLEQNWRSTRTILAAADAVIQRNANRKPKTLYTDNPEGGKVRVVLTDDEEAEADALVRGIRRLRDEGLAFRDAAVFVRTVAQTRAIEDAFRRASPPVPYEIVRGTSFYGRKEVRDILAYLEVLHNPRDEVNLRRIINTPPRGIGARTLQRLADWARAEGLSLWDALPHAADVPDLGPRARAAVHRFRQLMDALAEEPRDAVQPLIDAAITETGYADALKGDDATERRENLDELVTVGAAFDRTAADHADDPEVPRSLEGFLQTVCLMSDQDGYDERADRVPVMTLHAAKGLEFPAVFIAGCEDGLLPHIRNRDDPDRVEEERRLFFVGMTRAKQHLTLTYARYRRIRGGLQQCPASPFLGEIAPETLQPVDETTGTAPTAFGRGRRRGYRQPGADRVVRPERDEATGLTVGQVVRHPTYGLGRVARFATSGGRRMVRVHFNTVGEKLMDPALARLETVADA